MENKLYVSYAPHIRSKETVSETMLDVLISLIPALAAGVYFFGVRSLFVVMVSVAACLVFESLWNMLLKRKNTIGDLSAAVTGVLLAFCLPPTIPLWIVVIGDFFAIIIAKEFFGGLGQNIVNPALAARAFLLACWPVDMTNYTAPFTNLFSSEVVSSATPLVSDIKPSYFELFIGKIPGCIGEVSALCLIIGGIYLLVKKRIDFVIPVCYILGVGVMGKIFGDGFMFSILSGGVILAGFFMATDYVTSPMTMTGQVIYALFSALVTAVIRKFGGYPEGVTYAILMGNIITPLIDKFAVPKKFGYVKKSKTA
ncbi:MAG: RnfABCDGE type electron transport complex subunit D [Clostridia bacterium]|nr:RnfABCDGE type electron transport complex subunit D [Oscillospiraceae bacterium]MDY5627557.1 RnfABCDGE type electron transport complex subunit D [Clostridia bacterium]